MLPYGQLLDTYDLLEVFLARIVLGIGQSSLERRIHELANESPNSFVCKFARVEQVLRCFTATSIILSRRCRSEYMHDFRP